MNRINLTLDGPEVSQIAYGVWRLADDPEGSDTARVRAKIDACLEAGITSFDHADIYGGYTCEGLFGKALAEAPALRDQMEIITKCGIRNPSTAFPDIEAKHYDTTADMIEQCVERSLQELQTDRIDVLLIHRPDWLTSAEETANGLRRVMKAGKVLHVGVSNYTTHQFALLECFLGKPPVTNQVAISLLHMDAIYDGTLDQCQLKGVRPMAWSPLAGGRLFDPENERAVSTMELLTQIGGEYGVTPEQVALAWVAMLPSQPQVVIGTNQIDRIKDAAKSTELTLTRTQWYQLWEAAQGRKVP